MLGKNASCPGWVMCAGNIANSRGVGRWAFHAPPNAGVAGSETRISTGPYASGIGELFPTNRS